MPRRLSEPFLTWREDYSFLSTHIWYVYLIICCIMHAGNLKNKKCLIKIQSAAQNNRINLEAFSHPISQPAPDFKLDLPDDLQWELMSQSEAHTATQGHQDTGILWAQRVENVPPPEVRSEPSITIRMIASILEICII